MESFPQCTVSLAPWLESSGISRDFQTRYRRGGWLESLGRGAFNKHGEAVTWSGALHAIQKQARTPIHPGGPTALALRGLAHYTRAENGTVHLFGPPKVRLPAWFTTYDWNASIVLHQNSMLPPRLALTTYEEKTFEIEISAPERAIMECLYLAPKKMDLLECYLLMLFSIS